MKYWSWSVGKYDRLDHLSPGNYTTTTPQSEDMCNTNQFAQLPQPLNNVKDPGSEQGPCISIRRPYQPVLLWNGCSAPVLCVTLNRIQQDIDRSPKPDDYGSAPNARVASQRGERFGGSPTTPPQWVEIRFERQNAILGCVGLSLGGELRAWSRGLTA